MNKLIFGLLGALAFGASAVPSVAAPSIDAPLTSAVFHADGTDAHVIAAQYRNGPPRHYRHYRRHHRPHSYRGR